MRASELPAATPERREKVDKAREIANAQYAAVGICTDPEAPFDPWVWSGIGPELLASIGRAPRPIGVLGCAARSERPVWTNSTTMLSATITQASSASPRTTRRRRSFSAEVSGRARTLSIQVP